MEFFFRLIESRLDMLNRGLAEDDPQTPPWLSFWDGPTVYRFGGHHNYGAWVSPPGDDGDHHLYAWGESPEAALESLLGKIDALGEGVFV